jgi:hypothetical protein
VHGSKNTSLQELNGLQVNKSGLYTEFRDKEDLVAAWYYLESQRREDFLPEPG